MVRLGIKHLVRQRLAWLTLLWISMSFSPLKAQEWPHFPTPKGSKITIVADYMEVNSVPMQSFELTSKESPNQILDFYRREWKKPVKKGAPGYTEKEAGEWKIISRFEPPHLFTVQTTEYLMGGTLALLAVSAISDKPKAYTPGQNFPQLSGMEVQLDILSKDYGKTARTLVMSSRQPLSVIRDYYRDIFERKGFTDVSSSEAGQSTSESVLLMEKGRQELNMTLRRRIGTTEVVAVLVQ